MFFADRIAVVSLTRRKLQLCDFAWAAPTSDTATATAATAATAARDRWRIWAFLFDGGTADHSEGTARLPPRDTDWRMDNVEVIKRSWAAWMERDMDRAAADWHPDIVWDI